ncbi:MAG: terminase family protein [Candidatus Peribacteraceae bacterium]|nr:terminase family protein [Candidatus Peribacteraceae bacterium]
MATTKALAALLLKYKKSPLLFFEEVLNVELDKQQARLVHQACKKGSRVMVKSARGTGKTFIITGLTLYFITCFDDVTVTILSPSEQQLKQVFMREIQKHIAKMSPHFADYYDVRSMSIYNKYKKGNEAHCATASTDKTENVSGRHSDKQIYLLDEASAIPDAIYSTVLGSLGTAVDGDHVVGTSNPNPGANTFYVDLFQKKPDRWKLMTFTAFECPRISQEFIDEQKDLYGEDGDEYRVSVLGEFPRADGSTFIPGALVEEAIERFIKAAGYRHLPIVMGVDVARSLSGDKSVLCIRQGPKILDLISFKTADTMEVVARMIDAIPQHDVSRIYIDATGVGGGVADRARELIQQPVIDVIVAHKSSDPLQYANLRVQLWGEMRSWLMDADIPDHYDLHKELREMTWGYTAKMQMQLTAKKQLKNKGITSPDHADALALTFYDDAGTIRRTNSAPRAVVRSNILWC